VDESGQDANTASEVKIDDLIPIALKLFLVDLLFLLVDDVPQV